MFHNHWTVWAYEKELPNKDDKRQIIFEGIVEITLDADNEKEAIKLAKETLKRKYYRIKSVFRCEQNHISQDLRDEALMLQLEMQKQMLKKL